MKPEAFQKVSWNEGTLPVIVGGAWWWCPKSQSIYRNDYYYYFGTICRRFYFGLLFLIWQIHFVRWSILEAESNRGRFFWSLIGSHAGGQECLGDWRIKLSGPSRLAKAASRSRDARRVTFWSFGEEIEQINIISDGWFYKKLSIVIYKLSRSIAKAKPIAPLAIILQDARHKSTSNALICEKLDSLSSVKCGEAFICSSHFDEG